MDSMITDTMRDIMNNLAGQLITLVIIMGIAYAIPYFLLSLVRAPVALKNFISTLALLAAIYLSFNIIFLE